MLTPHTHPRRAARPGDVRRAATARGAAAETRAPSPPPPPQSNLKHTVTYATAGPNTRTTQLFVNYANNSRLDAQGFAPFGRVVAGAQYLDRVHDPTPGSSNGVDQQQYTAKGDAWIRQQYPEINFIKTATLAAPRDGRGPVVEAQR